MRQSLFRLLQWSTIELSTWGLSVSERSTPPDDCQLWLNNFLLLAGSFQRDRSKWFQVELIGVISVFLFFIWRTIKLIMSHIPYCKLLILNQLSLFEVKIIMSIISLTLHRPYLANRKLSITNTLLVINRPSRYANPSWHSCVEVYFAQQTKCNCAFICIDCISEIGLLPANFQLLFASHGDRITWIPTQSCQWQML